jgi:hypothetical protein
MLQPSLVPVSLQSSRKTSINKRLAATESVRGFPFSVNVIECWLT